MALPPRELDASPVPIYIYIGMYYSCLVTSSMYLNINTILLLLIEIKYIINNIITNHKRIYLTFGTIDKNSKRKRHKNVTKTPHSSLEAKKGL